MQLNLSVLKAICTSSLQGLVECELFSRFIHLVNHGARLEFVDISMIVPKGEEQTSINGKMLNSWLVSLKLSQRSGNQWNIL